MNQNWFISVRIEGGPCDVIKKIRRAWGWINILQRIGRGKCEIEGLFFLPPAVVMNSESINEDRELTRMNWSEFLTT